MIDSVETTRYGRSASEALARAVGAAQAGTPLAPVTVIVPSNFVGLSARRLLGAGVLGAGSPRGVANVSFVTPFRLAEMVASDLLLDRRPITNPVLGAAVRQVLHEDPEVYRPVADHDATTSALAGVFAELSNVDEAGLESIEDEGSSAALLAVRFHRRIAAKLAGFHTEHDLATAAADRIDLAARLLRYGHVVWYLPAPVSPAIGRFVGEVLRSAVSSSVIIGVTGATEADEPVWRACEVAGVTRRTAEVDVPTGSSIVSVTDAAEEVREVCSRIVGLVADGVSLHRIGVFFPTPAPYVRIIEQQFEAAGIPSNGPDPRRLADSVAARALLGVLALPEQRWRRDRVMDVISSGPLRFEDEVVRPMAWDRLSREAGVVVDHADWRRKIDVDRRRAQDRLAVLSDDPEARGRDFQVRELLDRIADGKRLVDFIDSLQRAVAAVDRAVGWSLKCELAIDLLRSLLGVESTHSTWPDDEQAAFGRVEDALVRLAALVDIEPDPSPAVFRRGLRAELDVVRGRHGRFGNGVVYGPIASAVGHDLDAVFVVGCAEGLLPTPRRDDAVLPESARLRSLDQLESRSDRLRHQHRAFLAALESAPPGRRTLTFPRGDLRSNRRALPSRWLLDTASALAGETIHATDFESLGAHPSELRQVVDHVASFAAGIRGSTTGTLDERDLVAFVVDVEAGVAPVDHPLSHLAGSGIAAQVARQSPLFTEFDGNLSAQVDAEQWPLPDPGRHPLSPSRLEKWASCGFRYFLHYVLEVTERDDPERIEKLSALDRGSLIHTTLERFVGEAIDGGAPTPTEPWTSTARERLHVIAEEVCEDYETTGRTGRRVNWQVQRDDLHDLLDAFLLADDAFRAGSGSVPEAVELDLGIRTGSVVPFELPNGRSVELRGMIDRVDKNVGGTVLVNDYKSGRGEKYTGLEADPFLAGTSLQLGMYAEGAMRATGATEAEAHYWLVESKGGKRLGYRWDEAKRDRFLDVLSAITDGIGSGVFAASPGEWSSWRLTNENCTHCDFDRVCVRDRGDQAQAKADAPELVVRIALSPPVDTDADADADADTGSEST